MPPIVSDEGYVSGQPRIDGHRIWVGHVVEFLQAFGSVEAYLENFPTITREQVRESLEYCMRERCVGRVFRYCQGCKKDSSPDIKDDPERGIHVLGNVTLDQALREWDAAGKVLVVGSEEDINRKRDLWKLAEHLYKKYFLK